MNEKNLPNWLLVAIVVGLGELSYYLWNHYGLGLGTKASMTATGVAVLGFAVIYSMRLMKRRKVKK